jgi:hypothetical protein
LQGHHVCSQTIEHGGNPGRPGTTIHSPAFMDIVGGNVQANWFRLMAHRLNDTIPLVSSKKNLYSRLRKTKANVSGLNSTFFQMIVNHNSLSIINPFVQMIGSA